MVYSHNVYDNIQRMSSSLNMEASADTSLQSTDDDRPANKYSSDKRQKNSIRSSLPSILTKNNPYADGKKEASRIMQGIYHDVYSTGTSHQLKKSINSAIISFPQE